MADRTSTSRPEIIDELDGIRARLFAAREQAAGLVDGLTDDQFNQRPEPGSWSICECLEHLNETGDKLGDAIDEAIARAHREGKLSRGPFRYGRLGRWFVEAASASPKARKRKLKTPSLYTPRDDQSIREVLTRFDALQVNTIERVEASNGIHLARVKVASPAARWLRLSLGLWLEMIAGHQERHLYQAAEVRRAILS